MRIFRYFVTVALCFFALAASAQDDDKGFLTRKVQELLSGAGRDVTIDGFRGALSSAAQFDRMTISDADGVWLVLEGAVLDWNRSALLRGRIEIENLTAKSLEIARLPKSDAELPAAEAPAFALPDLPVSVELANFEVEEIRLGAPVLGEAAALSVKASARLTDTVGAIDFQAERIDGKRGSFTINAELDRSGEALKLDLSLSEAEKGIAARLLNLPGQPSVALSVKGDGPLSDFTSDVVLETDGEERLAGQIEIGAQTPRRGGETPDRRLQADIGGDITAVIAPQYRDFFGTSVGLKIDALLESTGAVEVSDFAITSAAADLTGKVNLTKDKWPSFIDVEGEIKSPDGGRIALPGGGGNTFVERMSLNVDYDAANGEEYRAEFDITGLAGDAFAIARTQLVSSGILQANLGSVAQLLGDVDFKAEGLELTDAASAQALGKAVIGKATLNYIEGQPTRIEDLTLTGTDYGLEGRIIVNGLEQGFFTRLQTRLEAKDLSRFSALAGRELDGQAALAIKGNVTPLSGQFDLEIEGTTDDLALGIEQADAVLAGRTALKLKAKRNELGTFVRDLSLENPAVTATGEAELASEGSKVSGQAKLADISLVLPQYNGPVTLKGDAEQGAQGWSVDVMANGPYDLSAGVEGLIAAGKTRLEFAASVPQLRDYVAASPLGGPLIATGELIETANGGGYQIRANASVADDLLAKLEGAITPALDLNFDVSMPDARPLNPQLKGPLNATGRVQQTDKGFVIDTNASGPYGARASVEGLATGPDMQLAFDAAIPSVTPLVPGMRGGATAKGVVRQTPQGIAIDTNATGPYGARASVQGIVTGPDAAVKFTTAVPNIGAFVPDISGPLNAAGSAAKTPQGWRVDVDADGPSGTQATVRGVVGNNGALDLDVNGNLPLGLAGPFIAPRSLQGQATFDLSINGPGALNSVSGTVRTSNASLSAPNLRFDLNGIAGTVNLSQGRAQIDISGAAGEGGRVTVNGSVALTGGLSADLGVQVRDVVLIDPRLYRTSVNGDVRLAGPLTGGAQISGQIAVGETRVTVPSTGLTSIGEIPVITHIRPPEGVRATRAKAGLNGDGAGNDPARARSGAGFGLNVAINAPNRIFVRGRGLDAELGGSLRLTGTTNQIISEGRFDLLRGRLDILGKRFVLREGSIQFQGDLIPFIRFVSVTDTDRGEVRVIVQGPANEPEVSFESSPDAPQDEVLAQLLFGRDISEISAFQALQLANAVAVLAGKSGGGVVSKLRDGFGLDDLDVTTTDDGATALRLGKYLTDNIYTDVTASSDGEADISLNIDLTKNLKAKATLGSDGDSGLGIYFEKDY